MDIKVARLILNLFINEMEENNSSISYAAIVKNPDKGKNEYAVEFGSESEILGLIGLQTLSIKNLDEEENLNQVFTTNSEGRFLQKIKERIRPIKAGTSISDSLSVHKSGTLGILLSFGGNPKTYGLTNMHVASSYLSLGEAYNIAITNNHQDILQPSKSDGTPLKYDSYIDEPIGKTVWKQFDKQMDAALIEINECEKCADGLFNFSFSELDPYNYNKLELGAIGYIQGRTSGYSFGKILSIEAAIKMKNVFQKINNGKEYVVFRDQIMTQNIGNPGDSGSVLICNKQVVGLTFADINFKLQRKECYKNEEIKEHGRTFHNKISNILNAIKINDNQVEKLKFNKFHV